MSHLGTQESPEPSYHHHIQQFNDHFISILQKETHSNVQVNGAPILKLLQIVTPNKD